MRTIWIAALAWALPTSAHALGVGTTYAMGNGVIGLGNLFNPGAFEFPTALGFMPSLDLHPGTTTVQIHALETVAELVDGDLFLGANAYFNAAQVSGSGAAQGVVEPGFGVDLWIVDSFTLIATAEPRFGAVLPGEASVGAYVVPALGVAINEVDTDVVIGGTLQLSVWFGS